MSGEHSETGSTRSMRWLGGCQCGAVRYSVDPEQIRTLCCCHCRDCQKQSGSAFGMSLILPRRAFALEQGELAVWSHRRSEEHTSELQSLMRISYAVFCLKQQNTRR